MRSAYYSRSGNYSRSYRAEVAEAECRLPISRAKIEVAKLYSCPTSTAEAALRKIGTCEWHHVGKFATCVDYYDTHDPRLGGLIAHIKACGGAGKWTRRRENLKRQRGGSTSVSSPGRILRMMETRRRYREQAEQALGRSIREKFSLRDWTDICHCDHANLVPAARAVGWNDDRIALALASAGYDRIEIEKWLRQ